jgi:hypothetical protein
VSFLFSHARSEAGHGQVLDHLGATRVIAAGQRLHEMLDARKLHAPATFFQKTPRGHHVYAYVTWHHPAADSRTDRPLFNLAERFSTRS